MCRGIFAIRGRAQEVLRTGTTKLPYSFLRHSLHQRGRFAWSKAYFSWHIEHRRWELRFIHYQERVRVLVEVSVRRRGDRVPHKNQDKVAQTVRTRTSGLSS